MRLTSTEPAKDQMRSFAESAVLPVLKRLTMGLGLILFLSAVLLISDLGHRRTASARAMAGNRNFKVAMVYYAHGVSNDYCVNGLIEGLKESGLEEGKNLEIERADAQGDMINIPAILQNYDNSDVDLIMTISTPCLSGACNNVKHKKVVFTCVSDPIAAGAGTSRMQHLEFVTGVGSFPPVSHMLDFMQKLIPGLHAVGTFYNPAEANSVKEQAVASEIFKKRGIRLEQVAVSGSSEVLQAVQIIAGRDVQVVWLPSDNTAIQAYEGAVKAAREARIPLITDVCSSFPRGGLACLGVGMEYSSTEAGKLAGRVLQGADPKDLPIEEVVVEEMSISRSNAAQLGIKIPTELAQKVRE